MKFTKPPLSIEDQLAKLRGRGLAVRDEVVARWALRSLGYYRLSAYTLPFQQGHLPDKPFVPGAGEPVVKDSFTAEPAKHPDTEIIDRFEEMCGSLEYCDADEVRNHWRAYGYSGSIEGVGRTMRDALRAAIDA